MTRKVAIVTGASSGLGLAISERFARDGHVVIGIARGEQGLEAFENALAPHGEACAMRLDITANDAADTAVALALERYGRLDFLINNAGTSSGSPIDDTSDDVLDSLIDIHLRATFRLSRSALKAMESGSAVIHIASTYGLLGAPRATAYSMAKAGLVGLTRSMAASHGPKGIRTNAIAPGVIPTPLTAPMMKSQRFRRLMIETLPSDVTPEPSDIAAAAAFLCSPEARFINGVVLPIDGGWSATKYLSDEALDAQRL